MLCYNVSDLIDLRWNLPASNRIIDLGVSVCLPHRHLKDDDCDDVFPYLQPTR